MVLIMTPPSTPTPSNERRYYDALKLIAKGYDKSERITKNAELDYGLDPQEALEYAYDNIQSVAANVIHGKRRPK